MRYEMGRAYTGTRSFAIQSPPKPWKGPKLKYKEMVYTHDGIGGTIVTDALCGPKFEDTPVVLLAKHLFYKLDHAQIKPARYFTLDGREAVRVDGTGSMDGVPLQMQVVVMKKNFCLYDFVYFAPPKSFAAGRKDFENYYQSLEAP